MDDFNDYWVPRESINGSGWFHGNSTQPFTTPTYPVPLLFLLPRTLFFVASDLGRAVTKVKYTLFLFSPVSEQRSICVVAMECCH